ncbi:putative gustatory receptor clone PTE01 [Hypomesus transpacificus]|uniref:putative gustatory receptor clone PTE01 n=1 Tax=Hypomesus transpacificus TaxID=137520 RepID=UPI001F085644|nr:putative gustatory receptor clone PTE01 [Hypomesus transpacificus]
MENGSSVTELTLSGLNEILDYRVTLFCLTSLFYCVIIIINITLIVTIIMYKNLHEPMYIFICNLCLNGLFGTAGFYPKFLVDLLSHHHGISYIGCIFQGFIMYSFVCIDISLLAVMAYDRYVAICRPLKYHSIMTRQRVAQLVSFSWLFPLGLLSTYMIFTFQLKLCGSHIEKLYCAGWLILQLSCAATIANVTIMFYVILGIFIVCSYLQLIQSCLKSLDSRGKFMRTCVPHLLALGNITIAVLFDVMHMRFGSISFPQSLKNFMSIDMVIVPPLFNPLIYGLTLTQIRNRVLYPFRKRK